MNTIEICKLMIQRHHAQNESKISKLKYVNELTQENYDQMQVTQQHYQSFQRKIYTHENIIEMLAILKESADPKIILDEIDGYTLELRLSINNLPVLTVKSLKSDE